MSVKNFLAFLDGGADLEPVALIVLNYTLPSFLRRIWRCAAFRVCADGGADRLYNYLSDDERASFVPDVVKGDFDSVTPATLEYYRGRGARVLKDPDQDTTDLQKCLTAIEEHRKECLGSGLLLVVVLGALGGRIDHEMANMNMSYLMADTPTPLLFLSDECTATVLPAGAHRIRWHPRLEGPICGLIPLGREVRHVRTRGLKWDLDGERPLAFGGLVSSSNELVAPEIELEASEPLLWTTAFRPAGLDR
eukprot:tig00001278_g7993.t1